MATKTAIAATKLDAHRRLVAAAVEIGQKIEGIEALDLNSRRKKDRRKAEFADVQELAAVAEFVEQLIPFVGGTGDGAEGLTAQIADLEDQAKQYAKALQAMTDQDQARSVRLSELRLLLDDVLREKTKAELETFAEDYSLTVNPAAKKDEIITSLAEQLTGKRMTVATDVPEGIVLMDGGVAIDVVDIEADQAPTEDGD